MFTRANRRTLDLRGIPLRSTPSPSLMILYQGTGLISKNQRGVTENRRKMKRKTEKTRFEIVHIFINGGPKRQNSLNSGSNFSGLFCLVPWEVTLLNKFKLMRSRGYALSIIPCGLSHPCESSPLTGFSRFSYKAPIPHSAHHQNQI
jgi:hypothetical protein